jgi:type I restriction enzyme, S subunit
MKGWSKKRLVEITEKIGSGATPRGGNDAYKESGISLFRSLNVHDGFFKEKNLAFIDEDQASKLSNVQVKEGDVLLNITGASIARCCIAPSELLPARVNQHVAIIRPKLNYVDTNFLAYLFISKEYKDALLNTGEKAGATRQALTKIQLQEFEINIPPLSEQKRIVSIVDEAFEAIDIAIDNTKQNLTNARELFESYLNAIFTQKGDGWEEKKLEKLASKIGSGATPRGGQDAYHTEGISLIRSLNVHDRRFKIKDLAFIDEKQAEKLANVVIEEGDILLNITGASIARSCVVPKEYLPARVNQHVSIIRPDKSQISCRFLNYLITSKPYKDKLLFTGDKAGATRQALTKSQIQNFFVGFPNLDEQKLIVKKLDLLEFETQRLEAIYQQKLAALNELKQSILHKAFTGELTADKADLMTNIEPEAICT